MGRPLNRPLPKWCTISVGSSDGMAPRVSNDLVSDGQVMSKIREGKLPLKNPPRVRRGRQERERGEKRKEGEERKKQEEQKDSMGFPRR